MTRLWMTGKEEDEPEVKDQQLPDLKKGDVLHGLSLKMTEGKTKPPALFNEATLLSAMENPVAYMETKDKAMAKTLGRPAVWEPLPPGRI